MSKRIKEIKEMSAAQALNHYTNAGKWPCRKPGGEQDPLFSLILLILLNRLLFLLILLNRLTGDWA
jgi:hypothetical protein